MINSENLITAREAKGMSQSDLAHLVKCSQQLIGALESGNTKTTKFLPRIAAILGVLPGHLDSDYAELAAAAPSAIIPGSQLLGRRDFKIYASAEGGHGQIILTTDPVDFIPRPSPVEHVKEAYGLIITGDSMIPAFEPGDIAIVNPKLPLLANTDGIFYRERDGEARATIKRLRRETPDHWLLKQYNPPEGTNQDFQLNRKEWGTAHRVVGRFSRT